MNGDWWIFRRRPSNPIGKLFAFISAIWLATYLVGLIIINWSSS